MLNWESESDYAYTQTLDNNGWAVEFLRRDSEYHKDFDAHTETKAFLQEKGSTNWRRCMRAWHFSPPIKEGESRNQWRLRALCGQGDIEEIFFEDHIRKKWGISGNIPLPAPRHPTSESLTTVKAPELIARMACLDDAADFTDPEDHHVSDDRLLVAVNLKSDGKSLINCFSSLIDRLENEAKLGHRRNKPGNAVSQLTRYLRLLDAKAAGAKNSEIAFVLYPHEVSDASTGYATDKKIWAQLKTAQRWIEDYRELSQISMAS